MKKKLKIIKVEKLYFIFNSNNTAWIAVTEQAIPFCKNYMEGSLNIEDMNNEERDVYEALQKLEQMNGKTEEDEEIKSCYMHITQNCNLDCPMCYSKDEMRNKNKDLSVDTWKKIISSVKSAGFERLVFSGGEPLKYKGIEDILKFCGELKFKEIILITNGLLIDEDIIVTFKKYVDNLCVSLDGYDEESNKKTRNAGNFQKVVDKIGLLRKNDVKVNIISTIYRENIEDIKKYIQMADELDCTISFSLFTKSGAALDNLQMEQSQEQLGDLTKYLLEGDLDEVVFNDVPVVKGITYRENCGAGKFLISINADGSVYPCHFMMKDNLKMGNMLEDSLENILQEGLQHSYAMNVNNIEECSSCDYKYLCGGGCRAQVYSGKANPLTKSNDCNFYRGYYHRILEEIS